MPDQSVSGSVGSWLATRKLSPAKEPLAAVALALAEAVDDADQSASGRAAAAARLEAVLVTLGYSKAAEPVKGDAVDDIARRRAAREAVRRSTAADQ